MVKARSGVMRALYDRFSAGTELPDPWAGELLVIIAAR